MFWIYFLKLALAQIGGRLVLQPRVHAFDSRSWPVRHGAFAAMKVLLAAVLLSSELFEPMLATIVLYGLIGAVFDRVEETSAQPKWASFLGAQFSMVLVCAVIAQWWVAEGNISTISARLVHFVDDLRILWSSAVYLAAIFGGDEITRRVTQHFSKQFPRDLAERKPGLQDAGKYIGWLERLLIVTFVVGDYGEAVGFLLAVKALVRYPEIQEDKQGLFGEYFLVGTFTSVGIGLLGGLVLKLALTRVL